MLRPAATALAALLLSACATAAPEAENGDSAAELAARLAGATYGRAPGQTLACVEVAQLTGNRALGRELLLFGGTEGRLYGNRVPSCPALRYGHSVRLKTVSARLCRGNAVEILDSRGAVVPGNCTVGDFLTYEPRR